MLFAQGLARLTVDLCTHNYNDTLVKSASLSREIRVNDELVM